jgi:IS1 family transposase
VAAIPTRVVFGTMAAVAAALAGSGVIRSVNTSLIERHHLTGRHHDARKSRRTCHFSKD